jgi:D-alanyl-D-alanine carboxypeptidase
VSRRPRLTVRTRLTLLYNGLFAVCGATVVAVSYILVARLEPQGQGRQAPASFVARCRKQPPATDVTGLYPFPWAAGAIVSNAADTATFYRALLSGGLLSPKLLHAMQTTHRQKKVDIPGQRYGLGLIRYSTACGTAWGHNGAYPGYYVYDFTSADGQRQAVIEVNADPGSVTKTTGVESIRLLAKAYCGGA